MTILIFTGLFLCYLGLITIARSIDELVSSIRSFPHINANLAKEAFYQGK